MPSISAAILIVYFTVGEVIVCGKLFTMNIILYIRVCGSFRVRQVSRRRVNQVQIETVRNRRGIYLWKTVRIKNRPGKSKRYNEYLIVHIHEDL